MSLFQKAVRRQRKLRMALSGPSGSGKTFTMLTLAKALGQRVAVIDTEHSSASVYAERFDFDVLTLTSFHPDRYVEAIREAEKEGYDFCGIDSLSHAWQGQDGMLDLVDRLAGNSKDTFGRGWRNAKPFEQKLWDTMLGCNMHLIATLRAKTAYEVSKDDKGNTKIEKLGLAPVQRSDSEYEFDIVADMDVSNVLTVAKTRCSALTNGRFVKPGQDLADILSTWLTEGEANPRTEFDVNGRRVSTAGIGKDALLEVWNLLAAFEKKHKKGEGKVFMQQTVNKDSSVELTAEEGATLIEALKDAMAPDAATA